MITKYTDEDVRADPEGMRKAAVAYLREYEGSFHVLLELRQRLADGQLTDAQVRKTLNCMIQDWKAAPQLPPKPVPKPRPAQRFPRKLATRWRKVLGYSTYNGKARRIHIMDTGRSYIDYLPGDDRWDGAFSVHMRWVCSDMTHVNSSGKMVEGRWHYEYATQLVSAETAFKLLNSGEDWTLCKTCSKVLRGRLEKSASRSTS